MQVIFKGDNSADVIYKINDYHCPVSGTFEPICFGKRDLKLCTSKLYSLIPVWMTMMFTQYYRATENLELVSSSVT